MPSFAIADHRGLIRERLGMNSKKQVHRAYERDDAAITHRLRTEYPAIAQDAKHERTVIYGFYESRLRSDPVVGTGHAQLGPTPIDRTPRQRFS